LRTLILKDLLHEVILKVPVSVMDKVDIYKFVLHFYDDYADNYRNYQIKALLELNQQAPKSALHI